MLGRITISASAPLKVHTYTAPEDGWNVNSHLIELPTQVLVVDAQYTLTYAGEVLSYAKTLGKPINRLYITHYHPDHLLGAAAFSAPIYALSEVNKKIEQVGDRIAAEEHEKMGSVVPLQAQRANYAVIPGMVTIDEITMESIHLRHAETEDALMIGFPDQAILITQDLIYNRVHAFFAERAFDSWSESLRACQKLSYGKLLPGHGDPGDLSLCDDTLQYLAVAREVLSVASDAVDLKRRMNAAFPDFGARVLLDHQMRFLFPSTL
jgi:glyoxylase-like metal-dependent hydrolase (beta-lactamase superfamily II)